MKLTIEKKSNQSIRDSVYLTLKKNILNLNFIPGQAISESEIAEILGVSRTPVREAFLRLKQDELLEVYPQRGTFISLIDLESVEEARFMREHIERAVVQLACERFSDEAFLQLEANLSMQQLAVKANDYTRLFEQDEEFHRIIYHACNKRRIWDTIQYLNTDFNRIRILRLLTNFDWQTIIDHHKLIYESIRSKERVAADNIVAEHLRLVVIEERDVKKEYPNYFK